MGEMYNLAEHELSKDMTINSGIYVIGKAATEKESDDRAFNHIREAIDNPNEGLGLKIHDCETWNSSSPKGFVISVSKNPKNTQKSLDQLIYEKVIEGGRKILLYQRDFEIKSNKSVEPAYTISGLLCYADDESASKSNDLMGLSLDEIYKLNIVPKFIGNIGRYDTPGEASACFNRVVGQYKHDEMLKKVAKTKDELSLTLNKYESMIIVMSELRKVFESKDKEIAILADQMKKDSASLRAKLEDLSKI